MVIRVNMYMFLVVCCISLPVFMCRAIMEWICYCNIWVKVLKLGFLDVALLPFSHSFSNTYFKIVVMVF